jgi:hypothetical protein
MAFTYDISTNRGKVRFKLADTTEDGAMFTDAEVDAALSEGGSIPAAVCVLARARIAWLMRRPDSETLPDGRSISRSGQLEAMRALLAQYGGASGAAVAPTLPTARVSFGGYVGSDLCQPVSETTPSGG